MSALDMVLQRQVPARTAGRSSELGTSSNGGGESGKAPFADILSGQQRTATAKTGNADGKRIEASADEPGDSDEVQSGAESQGVLPGIGESDDVLALLNNLMSSAAYGNEAGTGALANGGAGAAAAGTDVIGDGLSGETGKDTANSLTTLQASASAARTGLDEPANSDKGAEADQLPPAQTAQEGQLGSGSAQTKTVSQMSDAALASGTAAGMAQSAAAGAKPASDSTLRERAKPGESREALRTLGLDGQVGQDKAADAKNRADQRKTEPAARIASGTSRQPEEKLENSSRNVEVLESRRFVAGQQLGGNAQMLARSIMDAGDAALATARAGPAQTSALTGQQQSVQTLHTLRLQLNPASLGSVTAVLKLSGEELQVDIKVETAEAYRQLSDDNQGLLKALRSQGYGVEQINIQHVAGGDRAQNQQTGAQPGFQGAGSNDAQASDQDTGNGRNSGGKSDGDNGRQSRESNSLPGSGGNGRTDGVYL